MKIVFIKDFKKYKINETVTVKDGYAINFLLPQGFAVPWSPNVEEKIQQQLSYIEKVKTETDAKLTKLLDSFDYESAKFTLHYDKKIKKYSGSVTNKMIEHALIGKLKKEDLAVLPKKFVFAEDKKINQPGKYKVTIRLNANVHKEIEIAVTKE